ncbi:hypothetical protein N7493_007970 [Penicillium malachiteum]|uniref:GATA-type domain-containing protein n=1 Tax=Penicillium malachiteum TaxID=1324776 RepID=A0AAD6HGE1_9EURO|nr:hypothetical protein N7493_007970 [Penicillium malachiteum]
MASTLTDDKQPQLQPICRNCTTSTTPLWRRDEVGNVLCNACGLFLKLHGRPRPISLKTDVIKSRNRVKTGQGPKRKSGGPVDMNGLPAQPDSGTPPLTNNYRRNSRRNSNGHSDRSNSPLSRNETPGFGSLHAHNSNIAPQHMFDSVTRGDGALNLSGKMAPLPLGSPSAMNDSPQTYESLLALNTSLKTRVSELDLINELFRGRVAELEQSDASARRSEMIARDSESRLRDSEARLRRSLEEAQHREEGLKRRITELETQLTEVEGDNGEPSAKRIRLADMVEQSSEKSPSQTKSSPKSA